MAELDRLKRKRTALRTVVSKLLKKVEDSLAKKDADELCEVHELLIEKKSNLKEIDEAIHSVIEIDSLEADVVSSEEYQEKCSRAIKRINRMVEEDKTSIKDPEQNLVRLQNVQSTVKLPKLVLEKYSGDPKKFTEFWNSYESTIDKNESLSKIEKFAYLKTLLTGAASNVVSSLELNEKNYDESIKTLKDRFGKKEIIISQFMNKLLNLEPVKNPNNIKALRRLYDEIEIAVRNLEAQGVTKGSFGQLLIPVLLKAIPEEFVLEFNRRKNPNEEINVSDLLDFIKRETECREASSLLTQDKRNTLPPRFEHAKSDYKKIHRNVPTAASFNAVDNRACIFCEKSHNSFSCDKDIKEKMCKLRNENRCFICFRKYHIWKSCRNKTNCLKCGFKSHHESLCTSSSNRNKTRTASNQNIKELRESSQEKSVDETQNSPNEHTLSVVPCNNSCKKNALLQTCSVLAYYDGKSELTNLIFDCGATRSFVHISVVKKLNLKFVGEETLSIYSFGMKYAVPKTYKVVEFYISDAKQRNKIKISCLVTDAITAAHMTTPSKQTRKMMNECGLRIACLCKGSVGILIGVDYYWRMVRGEKIQLGKEIYAISTMFGWVPVGLQDPENEIVSQNTAIVNLSPCVTDSLRSLWTLDLMGITDDSSISNEVKEMIESFEKGIRVEGNRYYVSLLWKSEAGQLENNFGVALRRFESLKNRLIRNPEIYQQYKSVIEEQMKEGIVEKCSQEITEASYFMPHKEIIKPKETTRCRIVYDASSSRAKGVKSLNDFLDIGPSLIPVVLDVILKFRKYEIAFSGDLVKAFLMIGILEKDREYLKFLWLGDKEEKYKVLRFKRLPFGLCCSPAILAKTIKFHIKKYKSTNPECYEMLNSSLYVDDLYYGADTIEDACGLSADAVKIFKDAEMNLRKLRSNSEELNSWWIGKGYNVELAKESKFLGMIWNSETDKIKLNSEFLGNLSHDSAEATKRTILQMVAKVYDPIGVFQPFVMKMKILLQKIWTLGVDWDDTLPLEIIKDWSVWQAELKVLEDFSLPRKYFGSSETSSVSLHVFADASPKAYGAVAYFRYLDSKNNICTSFIAAKGRVAPLKTMTLPRLELMAALVAAKLSTYLTKLFPELCHQKFLWSDSQITIYWIKGCARNWKPFVSNRVSEIQSLTDPECWFHCSGSENPADLLSGGESAFNLVRSSLWLQGPSWLSQPESVWPVNQQTNVDEESIQNEARMQTSLQVSVQDVESSALLDLTRFSRLLKVYRITAYVMRFTNNIKRNSVKFKGPLSSVEISQAELYWVNVTQRKYFAKDILDLSSGKRLEKTSSIYSLNPELDTHGLLRLKGRLQFSDFAFEEKHPWLLPYKDKYSELVILESHTKLFHAGVEATLAEIREKFWIIKGRQFVKSTLSKCFLCKRYKVRAGTQETAPLPPDRILQSSPFLVTGLDYAGPFFTKDSKNKHYLLLFTCATTRALHLELL